MLNDMRNYARPVSDQRQGVSIADLVTEAISIVMSNLRGNGMDLGQVVINKSIPAELKIKVSRLHIVAALVNVLKNACEFLSSDSQSPMGTVEIDVSQLDDQAMIVVRDTGMGIPAEMIAEIRQCLPGRTTRRGNGTGFGLCNAQRSVMAHDGILDSHRISNFPPLGAGPRKTSFSNDLGQNRSKVSGSWAEIDGIHINFSRSIFPYMSNNFMNG